MKYNLSIPKQKCKLNLETVKVLWDKFICDIQDRIFNDYLDKNFDVNLSEIKNEKLNFTKNMKTIVLLEGHEVFYHQNFCKDELRYSEEDFNMVLIQNLYEHPEQLGVLKFLQYDYLYINTTGVFEDKIKFLKSMFLEIGIDPPAVIFGDERNVFIFGDIIKTLKEKGCKFYFLHDKLEEINWI